MSNYSKFMPFNDLNISILIKTIRNDIKLSLNSKKKKKNNEYPLPNRSKPPIYVEGALIMRNISSLVLVKDKNLLSRLTTSYASSSSSSWFFPLRISCSLLAPTTD
jgi:hypothetical protein